MRSPCGLSSIYSDSPGNSLTMIATQHLLPGTLIRLADGAVAEIRENPRDGSCVIARRVG